jgi:hypothetical protein
MWSSKKPTHQADAVVAEFIDANELGLVRRDVRPRRLRRFRRTTNAPQVAKNGGDLEGAR